MAGLFARLGSIFTGKANDVVDSMEDPSSLGRQIIRDLDEKISTAQNSFEQVQGQLFLIIDDLDKAKTNVEKWSAAVLKASDKNDTALLSECVERLQDAEAETKALQEQHDSVKVSADALEDQIDNLNKERNKSSNTVRVMQTQSEVAKAQGAVADALVSSNIDGLTNDLGRLQRKVDEQSAVARAQIASQKQRGGDDLLERLDATEKESAADIVARLRNKQG
jgi:phage shock protein A